MKMYKEAVRRTDLGRGDYFKGRFRSLALIGGGILIISAVLAGGIKEARGQPMLERMYDTTSVVGKNLQGIDEKIKKNIRNTEFLRSVCDLFNGKLTGDDRFYAEHALHTAKMYMKAEMWKNGEVGWLFLEYSVRRVPKKVEELQLKNPNISKSELWMPYDIDEIRIYCKYLDMQKEGVETGVIRETVGIMMEESLSR